MIVSTQMSLLCQKKEYYPLAKFDGIDITKTKKTAYRQKAGPHRLSATQMVAESQQRISTEGMSPFFLFSVSVFVRKNSIKTCSGLYFYFKRIIELLKLDVNLALAPLEPQHVK